MNQDQIIKFLIDNLDADAFVEAKRNGTSIMYLAGVAQRWTGGNATQPTRNVTGNTGNERRRPTPAVQQEAVQDLTEDRPAPQPQPQPAQRRAPAPNQNAGQDRVRVSRL